MPSTSISSESDRKNIFSQEGGRAVYKVKILKRDIERAVNDAVSCDFDRLAKYFLYLALEDGCTEKQRLTELQRRIEHYEGRKYYPGANGAAGETGIQEAEELCGQRASLLDDLLEQSLAVVSPIADDADIRDALKDYCKKTTHETGRYAPYVKLCNHALDKMKEPLKSHSTFVFRQPSDLDIRFLCAVIESVGTTSLTAAKKVTTGHFWEEPTVGFSWSRLLMVNEIIMNDMELHYPYMKGPERGESETQLREGAPKKRAVDQGEGLGAKKRKRTKTFVGEELRATKSRHIATSDSEGMPGTQSENTFEQEKVESKTILEASTSVRCARYALEMMSYGIGVHHVINLMIIDEELWVWYYDRQGIFKANPISIVQDLPRFLVLLFAFQRFTLEDWGIMPALNPDAVHSHTMPPKTNKSQTGREEKGNEGDTNHVLTATIDITEDLEDSETHVRDIKNVVIRLDQPISYHPHSLTGRATGVFKANAGPSDLPMICKVYHPEVVRQHEGKIMDIAHYMANKVQGMTKHVPTVYFYGDLKGTSTHQIRSMVGVPWKGHRTCRIIGSKELQEITTLHTGPKFIKAWFEVLTCHAYLWKCRIEHGDPSVNNMMYDQENDCGVLTDFDLSICQWERRVIDVDRMGTMPFMALELLTEEYWKGQVKRQYYHELESFIWIIAYVFLVYQDGQPQDNNYVKPWEASNYNTCRYQKVNFLFWDSLMKARSTVQTNYKESWLFVVGLVVSLDSALSGRLSHDCKARWDELERDHAGHSERMWDHFVLMFEKLGGKIGLGDDFFNAVGHLKEHRPDFTPMCPESDDAKKLKEEVENRPRFTMTV